MEETNIELELLSQTVMLTSEIANNNIKKYVKLHQEQNTNVVKGGNFVMKVVEEAKNELKTMVDDSVKIAINNLNKYLELQQK